MTYADLSNVELENLSSQLADTYEGYRTAGLNLDLTRGKPAADQLDLSDELDGILNGFFLLQDGTDVRNYGGLLGIPEARQLGAEMLDSKAEHIMVGGNSSLNLMHTYVDFMMQTAWRAEAAETGLNVKFICPVPGYDRHFTICEQFGIEMLTVSMSKTGPDMDEVERLVTEDPMIKGIWCVPKYSNPGGETYSADTVRRFAKLANNAGNNFRIIWDNAYAVHHLADQHDELLNLMTEAEQQKTENSVAQFGSTSKVTFAGAGISFIGLSKTNLTAFERYMATSTIGFDKVNQLRHVRFLVDAKGIAAHMEKHRELIEPKFQTVQTALQAELGDTGIAEWSKPRGGYFISLNTRPGLALKIVQLAGEIGVKLTPAGATFPFGHDPRDENIRIAPTYPTTSSLKQAVEVLITCIKLASVRQLLGIDNE
ncbi:MAG: aspartate/methionine/tyrosine aminotransferase [Candidatus Azotimanducaceae bacterium]